MNQRPRNQNRFFVLTILIIAVFSIPPNISEASFSSVAKEGASSITSNTSKGMEIVGNTAIQAFSFESIKSFLPSFINSIAIAVNCGVNKVIGISTPDACGEKTVLVIADDTPPAASTPAPASVPIYVSPTPAVVASSPVNPLQPTVVISQPPALPSIPFSISFPTVSPQVPTAPQLSSAEYDAIQQQLADLMAAIKIQSTRQITSTVDHIGQNTTNLQTSLQASIAAVAASASSASSITSGVLLIERGGTGTSTVPSLGQILLGNALGGYDLVSTSSLGTISSQWTTSGTSIHYAAGSVGVGTSSPTARFGVKGTSSSATSPLFDVASSTDASLFRIGSNGRVGIASSTPAASLSLTGTAGTNPLLIASSTGAALLSILQGGNVGIGTAAPNSNAILDVFQAGSTTRISRTTTQYIQFTTDAVVNEIRGVSVSGGPKPFRLASDPNGNGLRLFTGTTDKVYIDNVGNVGIGSSTPSALLTLLGSSVATTTLSIRPAASQTASLVDFYNNSGVIASVMTAAGNFGIGTTTPGSRLVVGGDINLTGNIYQNGVLFTGSGGGGGGDSVWATSSANIYFNTGNVGIGTSTPSHKLDVIGTGQISSDLTVGGILTTTAFTTNGLTTAFNEGITVNQGTSTTRFNRFGTPILQAIDIITDGNSNKIKAYAAPGTNKQFRIEADIGMTGLSLRTNNAERLLVSPDGDILIGTATSSAKLMVVASSSPSHPVFNVTDISLNSFFQIFGDGMIGVGTTTPAARFSLAGSNAASDADAAMALAIYGGKGGANTTAAPSGFRGGGIDLFAGAGGESGAAGTTGGNGGIVNIFAGPGSANGDGTEVAGPGGAMNIGAGNGASAAIGGAGGAFTLVSGNGGSETAGGGSGIPANGGLLSLIAGSGGSSIDNSVNGGNGGNIVISGGSPGAGLAAGAYGKILMNQNGGYVGVGTSTPLYSLHVSRAGDGPVAGFTDANGTCTIDPTSTSLICSSDSRLKKDVVSINSTTALDKINQLQGVNFRWNSQSSDMLRFGFIAQDIEQIFPELVQTDVNGYKSVAYTALTPVLVEAIKQLDVKVNSLSAPVSPSMLRSMIAEIGDWTMAKITSTFALFGDVKTDTITVGTAEKPSGITLYDGATGQPYCLRVMNGSMQNFPGECGAAGGSTVTSASSVVSGGSSPVGPSSGSEQSSTSTAVTATSTATTTMVTTDESATSSAPVATSTNPIVPAETSTTTTPVAEPVPAPESEPEPTTAPAEQTTPLAEEIPLT